MRTEKELIEDKLKVVSDFINDTTGKNGIWIAGIFYKWAGMRYNTSYDWLMPVWTKVRDLKWNSENIHYNRNSRVHGALCKTLRVEITDNTIEDAFNSLYDAITWLNSIKQ